MQVYDFYKLLTSHLKLSIYKNMLNNDESFVFSSGLFKGNISIPVRVLSKKINRLNLLKNKEIKKNLRILSKFKNFVLVIINNEMNKKKKSETDMTLRYYGIGAQIIKDLKINKMILITKTPKKVVGLEGFNIKITKQELIY